MATTSNILTLLKFNCAKQKTQMLEYSQFCDYLRRYAQIHLDDNPDLAVYCGSGYSEAFDAAIGALVVDKQVALGTFRNKEYIFVIPRFIEDLDELYKRIEANTSVPFPSITDLPKAAPKEIVTKVNASEMLVEHLAKEEVSDKYLYCVIFSKEVPSLLLPSTRSVVSLLNLSLKKLQALLRRDDSHDYFLKKLTVSNPGKELSIKNFFQQFCVSPQDALESLKETGDGFYYWTQLCHFVRQDYSKVKDLTPEDISTLQSISVIEIAATYYKAQAARNLQAQAAFEMLDAQMKNPPYYFDMDTILKMKDKAGAPLLGQYTEEQLLEHLQEKTQNSIDGRLPDLLTIKVDEKGCYMCKDRAVPLVLRLANGARGLVREALVKSWHKVLLKFDLLPEMKSNAEFEKCLEREIRAIEPVLASLLDSSFLYVAAMEDESSSRDALFKNGSLLPYSQILMLSRHEVFEDAQYRLPFWYVMPVISSILKFIFGTKDKKPKAQKGSEALKIQDEKKKKDRDLFHKRDAEDSIDRKNERRRALRKMAADMESQFVPENSTLERELKGYMREWNDRIGKENYQNLGDDVDSLIRDYFRKILRTLKEDSFNAERIKGLAENLVDSPSLMKIKNRAALKHYVELYILQTVKNLPSK